MGSNIARRLSAVEKQFQATGGRFISVVVEPDETDAETNEQIERVYGPITDADTVIRIITGVTRANDRM